MSSIELLNISLSAIALGQSLLAVSLLLARKDPRRIYIPLIVFFCANVVTEASAVFEPVFKNAAQITLLHLFDVLSVLSSLLMAPALWFYVQAITSDIALKPSPRLLYHLIPFFIGLIICMALMSIPFSVRDQLIGDTEGADTHTILVFTFLLVFLILLWITQCAAYVAAIIRRLIKYRSQLKDFYASTEQYEMRWVFWVAFLLCAVLILVAADSLSDLPPGLSLIHNIVDVLMIWALSQWGLRQQPALRVIDTEVSNANKPIPSNQKYQRSAMTHEQLVNIAAKIEIAMREDQLYLEPNLSLADLSKHISVIPNYVSQTLNGQLQKTFFDYINYWRIQRAKKLLSSSSETVLEINYSVGFNSRSSFYKCFKAETGMTPIQYRQGTS